MHLWDTWFIWSVQWLSSLMNLWIIQFLDFFFHPILLIFHILTKYVAFPHLFSLPSDCCLWINFTYLDSLFSISMENSRNFQAQTWEHSVLKWPLTIPRTQTYVNSLSKRGELSEYDFCAFSCSSLPPTIPSLKLSLSYLSESHLVFVK